MEHQVGAAHEVFLTLSQNIGYKMSDLNKILLNETENTSAVLPDERIIDKIYLIRGQKVMLDIDLAELFSVKAIRLREQVKRNPDKFPEHFMFQLTESEVEIMVSQNAIPSKKHLGGSLPFAFF